MAKHPAIFLDRDGTITEDNGYINDSLNIEFYPNTFEALQNLQEHFLLFIITNCECKKPKPYFIHKAAELYNIDLNADFKICENILEASQYILKDKILFSSY